MSRDLYIACPGQNGSGTNGLSRESAPSLPASDVKEMLDQVFGIENARGLGREGRIALQVWERLTLDLLNVE